MHSFKEQIGQLGWEFLRTIGHKNYRRFVVLSRARSGSNLLMSLLNSHPNVYGRGEVFTHLQGREIATTLDEVFSRYPYYTKAVGFKLFYYHPIDASGAERYDLWQQLIAMENLHVIHLRRRNLLRSLTSRKIALKQGVWKSTLVTKKADKLATDVSLRKSVSFTPDELEQAFLESDIWQDESKEKFGQHPFLELFYEDLAQDTAKEFQQVSDFLGLTYVRPQTKLIRQNPEKLDVLIENYAELKKYFENGPWSSYFIED